MVHSIITHFWLCASQWYPQSPQPAHTPHGWSGLWFLPLLIYIHSYPRYFAPLTFSYPKLLIPPGILPHFFLIQCTIVPIDMSKSNWAKCMEISPSEYYPRKWDDFLGFWRFFACRIASLRRLRRSWSTERYRDLERFLLRLNLQVRRVLRWAKW